MGEKMTLESESYRIKVTLRPTREGIGHTLLAMVMRGMSARSGLGIAVSVGWPMIAPRIRVSRRTVGFEFGLVSAALLRGDLPS